MTSKSSKLTLVKNKKLDCLYHKESMLVFKSPTEKLVIGRIENDEIIPLDEQALELCQEHGFKYDESLVETEEASQEEEQTEEVPAQNAPVVPAQTAPVVPAQTTPVVPVQIAPVAPAQTTPVVPSQTAPQQDSNNVVDNKLVISQFSELLVQQSSLIEKHFRDQINLYSEKLGKSTDRIAELESQNLTLRKELDDTKKKMRGILAAIQADL